MPSVADGYMQEEWFEYYFRGLRPNKCVEDYKKKYLPPNFTYADFAKQFTAELYDPDHWADVIQASGAR